MIKVDCKKYADEILDVVKERTVKPLTFIRKAKGYSPADSYVNGIKKDCDRCGIGYTESEADWGLMQMIQNMGTCGGIVYDMPTDKQSTRLMNIDLYKDNNFFPCVVEAVLHIMEKELDTFEGKRVLVISRSESIGKPLMNELLNRNCTVTVAHSKTVNLNTVEYLKHHDVIISAAGKANLINLAKCTAELVVDVGINTDEKGKLCGDCYNFTETGDGTKVTTVPGGVGLLTRAILLGRVRG